MTFVEVLKKEMAVRELNENMAPDEIKWYCDIKRSVSALVYSIHELSSILNKYCQCILCFNFNDNQVYFLTICISLW